MLLALGLAFLSSCGARTSGLDSPANPGSAVDDTSALRTLHQARQLMDRGDHASARLLLKSASQQFGRTRSAQEVDAAADYMLAEIAFRQGQYEEAVHATSLWLRDHPGHPWELSARLMNAGALMNLDRPREAAAAYETLSQSGDHDVALLGRVARADAAQLLGRNAEAVRWLAAARDRSEEGSPERKWLDGRLDGLVRHALGEAELTSLSHEDRGAFPYGMARWRLAQIQLAGGQVESALETLDRLVARSEDGAHLADARRLAEHFRKSARINRPVKPAPSALHPAEGALRPSPVRPTPSIRLAVPPVPPAPPPAAVEAQPVIEPDESAALADEQELEPEAEPADITEPADDVVEAQQDPLEEQATATDDPSSVEEPSEEPSLEAASPSSVEPVETAGHPDEVAMDWLPSLEFDEEVTGVEPTGEYPPDPLVFLALLPLSGDYADIGERLLRALELGLFQDKKWVAGANPRLVVQDTGGDADRAEAFCRNLDAIAGLAAVIGPLLTEEARRCAPWAEAHQVPILFYSADEGLADLGPFVFQFALTRAAQTQALARHAVEALGLERFALMIPANDFGDEFAAHFWDALEAVRTPEGQKPRVVAFGKFEPGLPDYQAEVKKLVALDPLGIEDRLRRLDQRRSQRLRPEDFIKTGHEETLEEFDPGRPLTAEDLDPYIDFDAVFLPAYHESAALLVPQLALFDIKTPVLGTNGWNHPDLVKWGGDPMSRAIFTDGYWAGDTAEPNNSFVLNYQRLHGEDPGLLEAQAFDTGQALASVIRSRPSLRGADLVMALSRLEDFHGVTGRLHVDAAGLWVREPLLLTVRRGKIEPLSGPPEAASEKGARPAPQ